MKSYPHIRRALAGRLWYVHEQKMQEMLAFFELKLAGGTSSADTLAAIRAANEVRAARAQNVATAKSGAVAVLPIYGLIMHRGGMMSDISGPQATSTENLSQQLRAAIGDPNVSAIVLDVDSPGGDVDGVDELASQIYDARKKKKITAISNCLCASAAYYLASQASEVVASPSSLTGSIGVYTMHEDDSRALDDMGIKLTLIKYGENKAEGNSVEPLSDAARAHLQEMVDTFGLSFEKAVARGRGVKLDDVQKKFGQGRVFDAKKAVQLGLADRVGTLDDVLEKHGVTRNASGGSSRASMRADVGDPDDDCNCKCTPCQGGDCKACACEDCACDGCACDASAKARRQKAHARMQRELDIAAA